MGGTPSVPTDHARSLQVIGAGISRTGTTFMALALEKLLDGPVCHGGTQLLGREEACVKLWCDILAHHDNRPVVLKLLREATAGFVAVTDVPAIYFIDELRELYPDAKVVLVTRDPGRWLASMRVVGNALHYIKPVWLARLVLAPLPTWRLMPCWVQHLHTRGAALYGGQVLSTDRIRRHNARVRDLVPPDQLLTMELSQGWAPLAAFLNRDVPEDPFPHVNDSQDVAAMQRRILVAAGLAWTGILGVAGGVAWMVLNLVKHRARFGV